MGKTIFPFVSTDRQEVIKKVLKYFGFPDTTPGTQDAGAVPNTTTTPTCLPCYFPCCPTQNIFRCCVRQNAHGPETQNPLPTATPEPNEQANDELIPYPGHDGIKQAIPYIEYLRYQSGEINCNIGCKYPNVENLEQHVKNTIPDIMSKEVEIRDKIRELLEYAPQGDLLHLIRLVMLEIKDNNFDTEEKPQHLVNFCLYVIKIDCSLPYSEENKRRCERELLHIEQHVNNLKTKSDLLKSGETIDFLNSMNDILGRFATGKLEEDKRQAILAISSLDSTLMI
jgi:hypothetical protein